MYTVDNIISDSRQQITRLQSYELKKSLNHGKSILSTNDQLAAYISWYGEMHKVKCNIASQNFPYQEIGMNIHIIDWGCGQAIASLCFIESLEQRGLISNVRKVTLIEPSIRALQKAEQNINHALVGHSVDIECINEKLPSNLKTVPQLNYTTTIHLFSNILDIVDIDIKQTAQIIGNGRGTHFVMCIGPCNDNKSRIDDFCQFFTNRTEFSNIENRCIAYTSDTNHPITCKTRCFYIKSNNSQIDDSFREGSYEDSGAYDDYDTTGLLSNGLISEKLLRVYQHISRNASAYDTIFLKPNMGGDTPDIVIVRRRKGIVVMNVFEGNLDSCHFTDQHEFICNGEIMASPHSSVLSYCDNIMAEKSSFLLKNALKDKSVWYAVRPSVWFPDASKNQIEFTFQQTNKNRKVILLGADDFNKDLSEILDLQRFRYGFTDEACTEFLQQLKSSWHTFRDGDISLRLGKEQLKLAKSEEGKRQKVKGVAGSGKTQVLASRAVNCQLRTGGDILILTYNLTLVNYIRYRIGKIPADFLWNKFTITNYHRFFSSQARNHDIKMSLSCFENENFFESRKEQIKRYTAILIDEVQDYQYSWLKILDKYFLTEKGEFVLFGDAKQNIYKRILDSDNEIRTTIPGPWTGSLNHGMRFDNPRIASLALAFQKYFYPNQVNDIIETQLEFGFESEREVYYKSFNPNATPTELANECLSLFTINNLDKGKTVILSQTYRFLRGVERQVRLLTGESCMTTFETQEVYNKLLKDNNGNVCCDYFIDSIKEIRDNKKFHFTMDTTQLKIASIHSYKGWDADNVILIIQQDDDIDEYGESLPKSRPELIYTAITRAKKNLFILNMGNKLYDEFFSNTSC